MEAFLAATEASPFAATMRTSLFLYPVANVVHVLAALVFFASVAAMDVWVLRAATLAEARPMLWRVRPIAAAALVVQILSGIALFAPEATHIAHNPVFQVKLVLIVIALANVVVLEVLIRRPGTDPARRTQARSATAISLALWLCVAAAGRLIAYF